MALALYIPIITYLFFISPWLVIILFAKAVESFAGLSKRKRLLIDLNCFFIYGSYMFATQAVIALIYFAFNGELKEVRSCVCQILYGVLSAEAIPGKGNKEQWERGVLLLWIMGMLAVGSEKLSYPNFAVQALLLFAWIFFWTFEFRRQYQGKSNGRFEI